MNTSHTFYVDGMHCNACVVLTEDLLSELPYITSVKADLNSLSVTVSGEFGNKTPADIARELTEPMQKHGYHIVTEKPAQQASWSDFRIAAPIGIAAIIVFILLQKIGIVHWAQAREITPGTAMVVGVIASLSTCMAVVGGLVLSLSATYSRAQQRIVPQTLFHIGRLISFAVLGGVLGTIGARFTFGPISSAILGIFVGLVLLVLGINLLDIFPSAKKLQLALPKKLGHHALSVQQINSTLTPFLLGAVTFFLPCGFTQSMQLYALTTGTFVGGMSTMFFFALGTLPVLLLLSFTSVGMKSPRTRSIFFKSAGTLVIFFAVINILASLTTLGLIPPFLTL